MACVVNCIDGTVANLKRLDVNPGIIINTIFYIRYTVSLYLKQTMVLHFRVSFFLCKYIRIVQELNKGDVKLFTEKRPRKMKKSDHTCVTLADVLAIGLSSLRTSAFAWDSNTGAPLCPEIRQNNSDLQELVDNLLISRRNLTSQHAKRIGGVPVSGHFAAVKYR